MVLEARSHTENRENNFATYCCAYSARHVHRYVQYIVVVVCTPRPP